MNDCLKELGEFLARLGDVAAEHIYLTIFSVALLLIILILAP